MSHFPVIVVIPERPTQESLAAALQPYHEFECTGTDDQYVQTIDVTAERRKSYIALSSLAYGFIGGGWMWFMHGGYLPLWACVITFAAVPVGVALLTRPRRSPRGPDAR